MSEPTDRADDPYDDPNPDADIDLDNIPPWADPKAVPIIKQEIIRRAGDAIINLHGFIHRETEKAILFEVWTVNGTEIDLPDRKLWFPLSQIKGISHAPPANGDAAMDYDCLHAKEWICKQKDLL